MKYIVRSQNSQKNYYAVNKLKIKRKSQRLAMINSKKLANPGFNLQRYSQFVVDDINEKEGKDNNDYLINLEQDAQPYRKSQKFNFCDLCHRIKAELKCKEVGCRKYFHRQCVLMTLQKSDSLRCMIHYQRYYTFPIGGQDEYIDLVENSQDQIDLLKQELPTLPTYFVITPVPRLENVKDEDLQIKEQ